MFDQNSQSASVRITADNAIVRIKGTESGRYLYALTKIGEALVPHQRAQWNKSLEGYEKRNNGSSGDRKLGASDPLAEHCLLVADIYLRMFDTTPGTESVRNEAAVNEAKGYLLSRGFISERSHTGEVGAAVGAARESLIDNVYTGILSVQLGPEYDRIMALPDITDDEKRQLLIQASKNKREEMRREVERIKARPFPRWFWIMIGVLLMGVIGSAVHIASIN